MKCAVLISLYNAEKTLDKTFESLKAQTFKDFRIVAINDYSTDKTFDLLNKWQLVFKKDHFLIINNKKNLGLTKSLNKGLHLITEPYTARLDADDYWEPTKLEKQIAYLEKYVQYGIVGTWYKNLTSKSEKKVTTPVTDTEIKGSIFKRNPFAHSSIIFRTELIKESGTYDETLRFGQDYELWLRLLPKTNFANIPEFLCLRNIEGTLTSSGKNQRAQMLQCVRTQLKYLNLYNRAILEYRYIIEPFLVAFTPEWLRIIKRKLL